MRNPGFSWLQRKETRASCIIWSAKKNAAFWNNAMTTSLEWWTKDLTYGFAFSLQASSSEDMGRWIGMLLAETGSSTDPGALHYDYIDVEMTASVIQAAKQTFWWEAFGYAVVFSTMRIYICTLSLVPRELIKSPQPLCQILKSWSVSALQYGRCV